MRKLVKTIVSITSLFCVTSCVTFQSNKGSTIRFEIKYTSESIDKQSLDAYFLNHEDDYSFYKNLKINTPDILDHARVVDSSGDIYNNNFQIIRFSSKNSGGLNGASFLYIKDNYYPLGNAFGGYGLTEFIRRQGDTGYWLYYIYSFGSGIHRTHVGIFDIINVEFYTIEGLDLGMSFDYTFSFNEKDNTIDLDFADIVSSSDEQGFDTFTINKGDLAFSKIDEMPKTKVNSD